MTDQQAPFLLALCLLGFACVVTGAALVWGLGAALLSAGALLLFTVKVLRS